MSDRLLVATRKGLFTFSRAKGRKRPRWSVSKSAFLADPVSVVLADPRDGRQYVAIGHGHFGVKLHRSTDKGKTWHPIAAPAYPPRPDGQEEKDLNGKVIPWNTELVWALEAGHASEPKVLWCGTLPGGLFRSADGGDSWTLVESLWHHPKRREWMGGGAELPGLHSVCVDPRDGRRVAVGVSCGGVWMTEDGGKSWAQRAQGMRAAYMPPDRAYDPHIQDPHLVVQCPSAPQVFWAQHHNGIFRSTDGAKSWTEIVAKPSSFGFAVAVHPDDPDTAWFVPGVSDEERIPPSGKVIVTRTRNGGKSFQTLRNGLPQQHAYDLTYRHALDIDESGDRLAFGSTTGGLWVTEDQGDHWETVAEHLPPVYAVRFVKGRETGDGRREAGDGRRDR